MSQQSRWHDFQSNVAPLSRRHFEVSTTTVHVRRRSRTSQDKYANSIQHCLRLEHEEFKSGFPHCQGNPIRIGFRASFGNIEEQTVYKDGNFVKLLSYTLARKVCET